MLYAALKSGQNTLLVSNDTFGDHLHTLTEHSPEMAKLMHRWMDCHVIRFEKTGKFAIQVSFLSMVCKEDSFQSSNVRSLKVTLISVQLPTHHRIATQCDSTGDKWHVPYFREDQDTLKHISTWLCIAPERQLML